MKGISLNTEMAYRRDLLKLVRYLDEQGVREVSQITATNLNSYMLHMEKQKLTNTTISRNVASIRGFFNYLFKKDYIREDISEGLTSPKIERREPKSASKEDVAKVLAVPNGKTPKLLRDKAMIELLYSTGIMVEELVSLKIQDVNMEMGYLQCISRQTRTHIDRQAGNEAMRSYLKNGREPLLKGTRVRRAVPEYQRPEDEPSGLLEDPERIRRQGQASRGRSLRACSRHS